MKIIGSEPEIARYLLEGREITTKSTEEGKWHSTDEMGKQESLEICFSSTSSSRECVGVNYDKVTEVSKFNASINFETKNIFGRVTSPFTILSYLNICEEPNVKAKLRSKFVHGKNLFFPMETAVFQTTQTDYIKETIGEGRIFFAHENIPSDLKELSKEEELFWNEVSKIQNLNSVISSIKSKEKLFEIMAELKERIERANRACLDIAIKKFERNMHR